MPSQRRIRVLLMVLLAGLITILFVTSSMRQSQEADRRSFQDFYDKTLKAMDLTHGGQVVLDGKTGIKAGPVDHDDDGDIDADDVALAKKMSDRLKAAEQKAKDLANAKAPNRPDAPSDVIGVGSSAGGQKKKEKVDQSSPSPLDDEELPGMRRPASKKVEDPDSKEVDAELNRIFKKSPTIIFSKSYCPFSMRAKGTLLEKYLIEPTPYVVELDQHPLGAKMQARLADMTGRRTVPNIIINGESIGGSDDIAALDKDKKLVETIKKYGGKRVSVSERLGGSKAAA